jgi:hypothetical protein
VSFSARIADLARSRLYDDDLRIGTDVRFDAAATRLLCVRLDGIDEKSPFAAPPVFRDCVPPPC